MPSQPRERRRLTFRRLALVCATLLSCTTIRTPVSTIDPAVTLHEGAAEPQLELWVESNRSLSAAEQERYRSEARAALEKALAGRSPTGDEDELVVIRAQGVTLTSGRRGEQAAATAGMVVGAVVIVALVVLAIVSGKDHGGGGHAPRGLPSGSAPRIGRGASSVGRAGGAWRAPRFASAPAPRIGRGFPIPGPRRFPSVPAPGRPFVPAPRFGPAFRSPGPTVEIEVGFWWMVPYTEPPPEAVVYDLPPEPAEPPGAWPEPPAAWPEEPEEPAAAAPVDQLALPPPDQYPVEDRGFFDGDRLVLEATVLDRATGQERWTKRVQRKADPRDARAVKEAVDALLSEGGWQAPAAE